MAAAWRYWGWGRGLFWLANGGGRGEFWREVPCSIDGIKPFGRSWVAAETMMRAAMGSNLSVEKRELKLASFGSSGKSSAMRFSNLAI